MEINVNIQFNQHQLDQIERLTMAVIGFKRDVVTPAPVTPKMHHVESDECTAREQPRVEQIQPTVAGVTAESVVKPTTGKKKAKAVVETTAVIEETAPVIDTAINIDTDTTIETSIDSDEPLTESEFKQVRELFAQFLNAGIGDVAKRVLNSLHDGTVKTFPRAKFQLFIDGLNHAYNNQ